MTGFDPRRTPARDDLAAAHLAGTVTAPRYVEGLRMRVIDEAIPLRARPSPDCSLDTQVLFGEEVVIYDVEEGWAWGQISSDGYVGYMPADSLDALLVEPTHRVIVPRTFLYPGRSMKAPVLGALPLGALVAVTAVKGDFAFLADGRCIWSTHLGAPDARLHDFVATAELYIGVPYLWGGKTFSGLDCSGLVQVALQASGLISPRDTDMMQAELGVPVPEGAALRRGDIIFWKGHVGLMRDEATLLHANGHHMLVVSEPLDVARARIAEKSFGAVTAMRRLEP